MNQPVTLRVWRGHSTALRARGVPAAPHATPAGGKLPGQAAGRRPGDLRMRSGRPHHRAGWEPSVADVPRSAGLRGPRPKLPAVLEAEVRTPQGAEPAPTQGKETAGRGIASLPGREPAAWAPRWKSHVRSPTGPSPEPSQEPAQGRHSRALPLPGKGLQWVSRRECRDRLSIGVPPPPLPREAHALRRAAHRRGRPMGKRMSGSTQVRQGWEFRGGCVWLPLTQDGRECRSHKRCRSDPRIHQTRALQRLKI